MVKTNIRLTSVSNTTSDCIWCRADQNQVDRINSTFIKNNGLTEFGRKIIAEMNRLGMLVDLSHASKQTMLDVLNVTQSPVIYSHSSAYSLCNHTRNVHDDVLKLVVSYTIDRKH